MMVEMICAGFGGQGVLTTGLILAEAGILTPFDKVIAAVRTGNLDLSLALGNTDFLSALGALEDPVCFVAAFLAEEAADRGSQFQKLCVFCLPACNVLGKDAEIGIHQHCNGKQIKDAVCRTAFVGKNGDQQEKQKYPEKEFVQGIVPAVSATHELHQPFSEIGHRENLLL